MILMIFDGKIGIFYDLYWGGALRAVPSHHKAKSYNLASKLFKQFFNVFFSYKIATSQKRLIKRKKPKKTRIFAV